MNRCVLLAGVAGFALCGAAQATAIKGGSGIAGATVIDFEGRSEGEFIDTQYAGLTFTQDVGGRPIIDNSPFLYGFTSTSGSGVLTGSMEGGDPYPTVAGLVVKFDSPVSKAGAFISDTAPLGDYPITAYKPDGSVLETFMLSASEMVPYIFVGFEESGADIGSIQFGRSVAFGDAFSIDDFQYQGIPAPGAVALFGLGALVAGRRRRA